MTTSVGLPLPNPLRNIKRYIEILRVLIKYGFDDVVQELKLESLIQKGMTLVGAKSESSLIEQQPRSVRARRVLEELGPTFIKLGQILSLRPDLVPVEWANEFKLLQYSCPVVPYKEIEARIREEFPQKLQKRFRKIESIPLAAGSIAQIHRAILKGNTPVLVKVLRPGIEEVVEADIAILRVLSEFTEEHFQNLGYSPTALVNEFNREIHREMDLLHEARATERFRTIFLDDDAILFPKVYWEASTSKIMAVEECKGTLLSSKETAKLSLSIRRSLVENATRAVLCQCLEAGYFHADPHPGNLIAMSDGKIAFIDCGMVGQLDSETMGELAELVGGVIGGDADRVTKVIAAFTDAPSEKIEDRSFRTDIRELISQFEHTSLGRLNIGTLLQQFFNILRSHNLRCPADLVLLIKALATIQSVGRELDSSFDFVEYASPYVEKLVGRHYSISAIRKRVEKSILQYAELAESLPNDLRQIMTQLRKNKVTVNIEHRGLTRLTSTIEHASRNISFSMIIAAMLIGSSILVLSSRGNPGGGISLLGIIGFAVACVLLIIRFFLNRKVRG